jgi:cell division septum initiation protein DivIVA
MLQVQRFADETAADADRKAREVIAAAEVQASAMIQRATEATVQAQSIIQSAQAEGQSIVQAATAEGQSIVQAAQAEAARWSQMPTASSTTGPTIAPETAHALSASIEEFAEANRALVAELSQLRQTLSGSTMTDGVAQQPPSVTVDQFPVQQPPQSASHADYGTQVPAQHDIHLQPVASAPTQWSEPPTQYVAHTSQSYSA